MTRRLALALAVVLFAAAQPVSLINAVRGLIAQNDLAGAERLARSWQARNPASRNWRQPCRGSPAAPCRPTNWIGQTPLPASLPKWRPAS